MNEVGALLTCVLKRPDDLTAPLVLADWLEEQGDPDSLARAELLRLRAQWAGAASGAAHQRQAEARAAVILKERPALLAPLEPLLKRKFRLLAAPSLALFLVADYSSATDPLTAGSTWEGKLKQPPYAFPTTLRIARRDGNRFAGDMTQNFHSLYRTAMSGTFHFRGVVAGAHVAFVTWRIEGAGSGPGLYQFRIGPQHRLTGTWAVGTGEWNGKMWLKPKPPAHEAEIGAGIGDKPRGDRRRT